MHSMSKDLEQMCSFTSFNRLVKDGKYQQVMYSSLLLLPGYSSHISGSLEMEKGFVWELRNHELLFMSSRIPKTNTKTTQI